MEPRRLSNKEQADLPDSGWYNFSEDPKMYCVSFWASWEVSESDFLKCKDAGILCIERNNRFYIAR